MKRFTSMTPIACLLGSAIAISLGAGSPASAADPPAVAERPATPPATDAGPKTVEELTRLVRESVVVVSFSGRDGRRVGLGSGFVISPDGLIATNLHVIGDARPITVQTADGKRHAVETVHATERSTDLAILKIDAEGLPALPLGDSDTLRQGEDVVALGNPQGLTFSVVRGVVSGRREIDGQPMIQLAMPIEQGNSGGPVLDMSGRVHGIVSMKSTVTPNLGFAVAVNALKPLIENPNPIPMSRWLTVGALDAREWETLFGSRWRQRAGRITVDGVGSGFGGRSLALQKSEPPELPYEVQVAVRLEDESGAAGLVFHSDGHERHYGFYPSDGKLRLSRFSGPDVFSWQVLDEVESEHYRPGGWNVLKVRVEDGRIQCFVNDEPVIESGDAAFRSGRVGLAKFRETVAEFKQFRLGRDLPPTRPSDEVRQRIVTLAADLPGDRPPRAERIEKLIGLADATTWVLEDEARELEQRAERLRQLAQAVHEAAVYKELTREIARGEAEMDLLRAALLIARLDNEDLDVDAYLRQVDRMAEEIRGRFAEDASESDRIAALDKFLFEELGFHGSRVQYYHQSNSYLNEVIDDREGLPIMLSVLYMEVARRVGLNVVGVGLPGHFVVRHEPAEGQPQIINPFDRGERMSDEEARELIRANTGEFDAKFLRAQTKREILIRILHNLMNVARDDIDPDSMLRYVDAIVTIDPDAATERWYRAVLRFQTDRHAEARDDCDWLLREQPPGIDLDQVRELRGLLRDEGGERT